MKVTEGIDETLRVLAEARRAGRTVGLVPTMGALHEGHLSLIAAAAGECDFVVVSIFVNPTQFAPGEDLDAYPRPVEADLAACREHGVAMVFAPTEAGMYPRGRTMTEVAVDALSGALCGASRPGHFAGVCTVVAKLFNIIQPDKAFFGAKDRQQAIIIERMASDLDFPVEIVVCPTVREADGLAMSSRNAYLSAEQRSQAAALWGSLKLAERMIRESRPPAAEVLGTVRRFLADEAPLGEIDYVQIVDPQTLADVETTERRVLVALAVRFGHARLIDNVVVDARE